jgi:thiol-disulfide isomerase/thioredoxin
MVATASLSLGLGSKLPEFTLKNAVDGQVIASQDLFPAPALLVMFLCNHCPYVIHVRPEIRRLADDYLKQGVAMVAINSNSERTHPQDGPAAMKQLAQAEGWLFPFVFDEDQTTAHAFRAVCTPEFFLFDSQQSLVYHGQLDGSRPGSQRTLNGNDMRKALDAVLVGKTIDWPQTPSVGCSIKWAPGNQPK